MDRPEHRSAAKIAGVYVFLGVVWIGFSDRLVLSIATSGTTLTLLQTAKGWIFVGTSAILIYALVLGSQREIVATNEELRTAITQASILHRILRHNLRNACNVIGGNLELLADRMGADDENLAALRRQNDRLVSVSEKSRHFRLFLDGETSAETVDLAAVVERRASLARERFPHAGIAVDVPARAPARAHRFVGEAIEELVENAVEHNPSPEPTVWLSVDATGAHTAVTVADDGPGIPRMERETFERGSETQVQHSRGIGLWLVRMTVLASGGTFEIRDRRPRGASVRISLVAADDPPS